MDACAKAPLRGARATAAMIASPREPKQGVGRRLPLQVRHSSSSSLRIPYFMKSSTKVWNAPGVLAQPSHLLEISAALLVGALAGVFLWLPVDDMMVRGLFHWHLVQPQTLEGGAELVVVGFLIAGLLLVSRKSVAGSALAVGILLELYLRRHHVDLPAVAVLLYLETLVAAGASVERIVGGTYRETLDGVLGRFLAGSIVWALMALGLSALGHAGPIELRLATAALACICFPFARRRPLCWQLAARLPRLRLLETVLVAFFLTQIACLFARTNVTVYHDSLWYGLRGQYVLAPNGGSFFQSLGLVNQVHYYPKLLEVFFLPLSGLGDFSFIMGFNIALYGVLLIAMFRLGRRLGLSRELAMLASAVAGTLPALANIPLTSKADLFGALWLSLAALYFWDFLAGAGLSTAILGLSCVALSFAAKLTSLPYGGLLVLAAGTAAFVQWRRSRDASWESAARTGESDRLAGWPDPPAARRLATFGGVGSGLILFGFTLRTYLLTGLPTIVPAPLTALWHRLGFSLRYPVAQISRHRAEDLASMPSLAYDFLFRPTRLPLARITWPGNVWLFLLVAGVILALAHRSVRGVPSRAWVWVPVSLSGAAFALAFNNAERGGDGNYYMFPLILGTLLSFTFAMRNAGRTRGLLVVTLVPFVLTQTLVGFITAAWAPGTRSWDLDFTRSAFDSGLMQTTILHQNGLERIAAYLRAQPGSPRVVGMGPEDVTRWLPARFESYRLIDLARPDRAASPATFLNFLKSERIGFLLLPKVRSRTVLWTTAEALRRRPGCAVVEDTLYRLVDIRRASLSASPTLAPVPPRSPGREVYKDLVRELGDAETTGQGPLQAPWGRNIARADAPIELYAGAPSLVTTDGTTLRYALHLPDSPTTSFSSQVGLYLPFQVNGVSDGVEVKVTARAVGAKAGGEVLSRETTVTPRSAFTPIELPLVNLAGQDVEIGLEVFNQKGRESAQDWVVWVDPVIAAAPSRGIPRP